MKEKYKTNGFSDRARRKQAYFDNWDRERENRKIHREQNPELHKQHRNKYYTKNKEQVLKKNSEYRVENRKKINEYFRDRYKNDLNFKIASRLRTRFNRMFRNGSKIGSAVSDLGCSIQEFRSYIESKFEPWMNWDNYGEYNEEVRRWNFDHIKPLISFDLSDPSQVKIACNYNNIRPFCAKQNLIKHDELID